MGMFDKTWRQETAVDSSPIEGFCWPCRAPLFVGLHCCVSVVIFRAAHKEGKGGKGEWLYKNVDDIIKRAERYHINSKKKKKKKQGKNPAEKRQRTRKCGAVITGTDATCVSHHPVTQYWSRSRSWTMDSDQKRTRLEFSLSTRGTEFFEER